MLLAVETSELEPVGVEKPLELKDRAGLLEPGLLTPVGDEEEVLSVKDGGLASFNSMILSI